MNGGGRAHRHTAFLLGLITVVLATGCGSPSASSLPTTGVPDRTLLPPAAAVPTGDPSQAAAALAEAVHKGGASGIAALRRAVVMSGFEIVDLDGTVVDKPAAPGNGGHVVAGELHSLINGMTTGFVAPIDLLLGVIPQTLGTSIDAATLRAAALGELRDQAASKEPTTQFLALFVQALGKGDSPATDVLADPPTVAQLDAVQTYILLQRWGIDLASFAAHRAGASAGASAPPTATQHRAGGSGGVQLLDRNPCQINPDDGTYDDALNGAVQGSAGAFAQKVGGGALNKLQQTVNALFSLARLIGQSFHLKGTMILREGQPLVRTQDRTAGEKKTLELHLFFDFDSGQMDACQRLEWSAAGIDPTGLAESPLSGAPVSWEIWDSASGPAGYMQNPAEFYYVEGKGDDQTTTNADGVTHTGFEGRAQKSVLPKTSPPWLRSVRVLARAAVKDVHLADDIVTAAGLPLSNANTIVGIIESVLEHMPYHGLTQSFQVKDWYKDFKIDADARYYSPGDSDYPHLKLIKCNGIAGTWTSSDGALSFDLDENGHGTYPTDLGPLSVTLNLNGTNDNLHFENPAIRQEWPVIPGDWCDGDTPR